MLPITWTLGDVVRKLRDGKGWNQDDLAEAAQVHKTSIGALENDDRTSDLKTLTSVTGALQAQLSEVLAYVELSNVFLELREVEQQRVTKYARLLIANREDAKVQDSPPVPESPIDRPATTHEPGEPIQKRRRR